MYQNQGERDDEWVTDQSVRIGVTVVSSRGKYDETRAPDFVVKGSKISVRLEAPFKISNRPVLHRAHIKPHICIDLGAERR